MARPPYVQVYVQVKFEPEDIRFLLEHYDAILKEIGEYEVVIEEALDKNIRIVPATKHVDYHVEMGKKFSLEDLVCPRKVVWNGRMTLSEFLEKYDETVGAKMGFGREIHSFDMMRKEYKCKKDVRMRICGKKFKADYVCKDENGKEFVVEVKTKVWPELWELYKWQTFAYANKLGVKKVVVISVVDGKAYEVDVDEYVLDKLCRHIEMVERDEDVPNRGPWCARCWFNKKCKG